MLLPDLPLGARRDAFIDAPQRIKRHVPRWARFIEYLVRDSRCDYAGIKVSLPTSCVGTSQWCAVYLPFLTEPLCALCRCA